MPKKWTHCAISKKRTGKSYKELHEWMDKDEEGHGVDHRKKNHHYTKELLKEVKEKFGGAEAVSEWLFHIALDNLDTSVFNDWRYLKRYTNSHEFGFEGSGYIHYKKDKLNKKDFKEKFPEDNAASGEV